MDVARKPTLPLAFDSEEEEVSADEAKELELLERELEETGLSSGGGFRTKAGKPGRRKGQKWVRMSAEVAAMMGEANMLHAQGDNEQAVALLQEIVRLAPKASDPYITLGAIHEERKDDVNALVSYNLAAELDPTNANLWLNVARSARKTGRNRLAAFALRRAFRYDDMKMKPNHLKERIAILDELHDAKAASRDRELLAGLCPMEPALVESVIRNHFEKGAKSAAIALAIAIVQGMGIKGDWSKLPPTAQVRPKRNTRRAIQFLEEQNVQIPFNPTIINMLVDLLQDSSLHDNTVALLKQVFTTHYGKETAPLELVVKYGVSLVLSGGRGEDAKKVLRDLEGAPIQKYSDLYYDAAVAFYDAAYPEEAYRLFSRLYNEVDVYHVPLILLKRAMCLYQSDRLEEAEVLYRQAIENGPIVPEAVLQLAKLMKRKGELMKAVELISNIELSFVFRFGHIDDDERYDEEVKAAKGTTRSNVVTDAGSESATKLPSAYGAEVATVEDVLQPSFSGTVNLTRDDVHVYLFRVQVAKELGDMKEVILSGLPLIVSLFHRYKHTARYDQGTESENSDGDDHDGNTQSEEEDGEEGEEGEGYPMEEEDQKRSEEKDRADQQSTQQTKNQRKGKSIFDKRNRSLNRHVLLRESPMSSIKELFDAVFDAFLKLGKVAQCADILRRTLSACKAIPSDIRQGLYVRMLDACVEEGLIMKAIDQARSLLGITEDAEWVFNYIHKIYFAEEEHQKVNFELEKNVRRWSERRKEGFGLVMVAGHMHMKSAYYRAALIEYMRAWKLREDPLTLLCIASVFLNSSRQRTSPYVHRYVALSFAFLSLYRKLRRASVNVREHNDISAAHEDKMRAEKLQEAQSKTSTSSIGLATENDDIVRRTWGHYVEMEIAYNLGRCYHQLSILEMARVCYEEALHVGSSLGGMESQLLHVQEVIRRSAFNLFQLLQSSGSTAMAASIAGQYLVW